MGLTETLRDLATGEIVEVTDTTRAALSVTAKRIGITIKVEQTDEGFTVTRLADKEVWKPDDVPEQVIETVSTATGLGRKYTLGELADMPRELRAARTHYRCIYHSLLPFYKAVWEADRANIDLGLCGRLDFRALIEDVKELGEI